MPKNYAFIYKNVFIWDYNIFFEEQNPQKDLNLKLFPKRVIWTDIFYS